MQDRSESNKIHAISSYLTFRDLNEAADADLGYKEMEAVRAINSVPRKSRRAWGAGARSCGAAPLSGA